MTYDISSSRQRIVPPIATFVGIFKKRFTINVLSLKSWLYKYLVIRNQVKNFFSENEFFGVHNSPIF